MSKLSVIMPVYKVEAFLQRSVQSILAQTWEDWELFLVDDGSPDGSSELCDRYAAMDGRITVIHKQNAGAGSARNTGLVLASGEFVAFPDSDDWIEADAYRSCIEHMETDSLDLLLFGSLNTTYSKNGSVEKELKGKTANIKYFSQKECRDNWIDLIINLPMDGPSNKIYRMHIIRNNKIFFPDIRRMQDGVFNMRYYQYIHTFAAIPEYFYHFTMHSAGYQRKKIPPSFLECVITYHRTAVNLAKEWGILNPAAEVKLGNWFSETILTAELEYFSQSETGFLGKYRHIRAINRTAYIMAFYSRYRKLTTLNKKEIAASRNWNLLLAVYASLKNK